MQTPSPPHTTLKQLPPPILIPIPSCTPLHSSPRGKNSLSSNSPEFLPHESLQVPLGFQGAKMFPFPLWRIQIRPFPQNVANSHPPRAKWTTFALWSPISPGPSQSPPEFSFLFPLPNSPEFWTTLISGPVHHSGQN